MIPEFHPVVKHNLQVFEKKFLTFSRIPGIMDSRRTARRADPGEICGRSAARWGGIVNFVESGPNLPRKPMKNVKIEKKT